MNEHKQPEPTPGQLTVDEILAAGGANGKPPSALERTLAERVAELEAEKNARNTAVEPDAEPDARQTALANIGDYCEAEMLDIERVGADLNPDRYFVAKHRLTGETRKFGPVTSAQLGSPKVWRLILWEAAGGNPGPILEGGAHRDMLHQISVAERVVEHGHDDAEMWRDRILAYLHQRLVPERKEALTHGEPFEQDDRVWISAASLAHFLRLALKLHDADDHAVKVALAHAGFGNKQLTWRDGNGKVHSRRYWYSSPGFTDGPAEGDEV